MSAQNAVPTVPAAPLRVLLYGDVDLNIIDGSAVWLASIAQAWADVGAQVDIQLKAREHRGLLSDQLRSIPGVRVHPARPEGTSHSMPPARAAEVLSELAGEADHDVVMARGIHICAELVRRRLFADRLWSYVTEFEYPARPMPQDRLDTLDGIAAGSRLVLAQTEDARAVLESLVPAAAGRTVVLAPMIPDDLRPAPRPGARAQPADPLRLVYTGKFARRWRTDLMPEVVTSLRRHGVRAELTMVGDKVQRDPQHRGWTGRMQQVIDTEVQGVHWAGGHGRRAALDIAAAADVALCWRSPELDLSLELSSKVLECCALGVPPVLNRTAAHEQLLGADYPLFLDPDHDDPDEVAGLLIRYRDRIGELSERVAAAAEPYRTSVLAPLLLEHARRLGLPRSPRPAQPADRPTRVLMAGHDFKFAGELVDLLTDRRDVELRLDHWSTLHHHDEAASQRLVDWADVVMCEWAGPNAIWYARHRRPGQRLVVRLHMFELRGPWLEELDTEAVDRFVTVSAHYRDLLIERLGVPAEQVTVIPNAISTADLDRPGLPDRRHRLGVVGIVPLRKRLDRALDLLRELHRTDPRYTLHVRGKMPWEYPHEWRKPVQREAYMDLFACLGQDPIRQAVAFEPFGADMATWLRKIGWVLSPSTVESFHLAPAEGMAAGALPVLWERPGAREIFGDEFVVQDTVAAARFVLETDTDDDGRAARQRVARRQATGFDERVVSRAWAEVLLDRE